MRSIRFASRATLLACALLTAAVPGQAGLLQNLGKQKASTPTELAPGADPAALAAELVTVEQPENIAGQRTFALAGFTVEFQVMAKDYASQFGSTVASKTKLSMEGVTPADMQAITDQVYADFQERMKAQGITLLLPADLAGKPAWEKIAAMGKGQSYEMSAENDKLLLFAPTGRSVIPVHPDEQTERLAWGLSGLKALSSGTLPQAEIALAKELGHPVMKAHFVVRFGAAEALAVNGSGKGSVKVSGLILGDGQSGLSIRTANDNPLPGFSKRNMVQDGDAFVRLARSIASNDSILAADVRKAGGTNKALGNALVSLTGAGSFAHEFVAPLDAARYAAFGTQTLDTVSEMFARRLAQAAGP